ncbi:uncharacterized protein LOC132205319 [Neocloeon triangulifer]|uniref:uncharacterized protein LOC132205319 n=1 Tax=Neocloeon triangulifer TaxID=2078957 RepID=UPI00286F372A|nr:uncharacterized protein LOC132205319 [Neocloeon triangulifer]
MKALFSFLVILPFLACLSSCLPTSFANGPDAAAADLVLKKLNLTAESRLGGVLVAYLQARRNTTRWRPRRNVTQALMNAIGAGNRGPSSNEDDDYYYDEEEYPDIDLSPESILIYVLELFGTMIGLTWGAVSTLFG